MTNSMTAFARCEQKSHWGELIWEIRSVNHRYLEIYLRLPDELRAQETVFRQLISQNLKRGRIDATLRYTPGDETGEQIDFNVDLVRRLGAAGGQLYRIIPQLQPLRTIDVMQWPGVLKVEELDADKLAGAASELLSQALSELGEARRREGAELAARIQERLDSAAQITGELRHQLPQIQETGRIRLSSRLADLKEELDPARVEQEIVLLLSKMDVDEELDRIDVHLDETRRVLALGEPVGRRLDFLMQEINREANTLGSKAADLQMTDASVNLKVLIEQIREQVQNIE